MVLLAEGAQGALRRDWGEAQAATQTKAASVMRGRRMLGSAGLDDRLGQVQLGRQQGVEWISKCCGG